MCKAMVIFEQRRNGTSEQQTTRDHLLKIVQQMQPAKQIKYWAGGGIEKINKFEERRKK
jgi:hypothetical protein